MHARPSCTACQVLGEPMPEPVHCPHQLTRLVARDQDAEYLECLDCGAILEKDELEEPPDFNESLSDA